MKTCERCGSEFHKPPRGSHAQWARRRFCSTHCATVARRDRRESETRLCARCGDEFARHPKESARQWRERRFCGRRCAARWRVATAPPREPRACAGCGDVGPVHGGQLCRRCYDRARYEVGRPRILAANRAWRRQRPDYFRQPRFRDRYRRNARAWARANPQRHRRAVRQAKLRRRARLASATLGQLAETNEYLDVLSGDPCAYCGALATTVDHIEALSRGGNHDWENLTAACRRCNSRKQGLPLLMYLLSRDPTQPHTGQGLVPARA